MALVGSYYGIRQRGTRAPLVIMKLELRCAARAVLEVGTEHNSESNIGVNDGFGLSFLVSVDTRCLELLLFFFVPRPGSASLAGSWVRDEILFGGNCWGETECEDGPLRGVRRGVGKKGSWMIKGKESK